MGTFVSSSEIPPFQTKEEFLNILNFCYVRVFEYLSPPVHNIRQEDNILKMLKRTIAA